MRLDHFELSVVEEGSLRPLPEVSSGGRSYAVAAPGLAFQILFQADQLPGAPDVFYKVYLSVDGRDMGYSKVCKRAGRSYKFLGFLQRRDSLSASYATFVFSQPTMDSAKCMTTAAENAVEGKIVCEVWESVPAGPRRESEAYSRAVAAATVAALPEGKKFFMAPSLTTSTGPVKQGNGFYSTRHKTVWPKVGDAPVATLELRYETAATLMLRGVLDPEVPEHQAIIERFEGPRQLVGAAGEASTRSAEHKATAGAEQGEQQRQRQQEQQQEPEEIDLTEPEPWQPRESDPLLAAKREGKEVMCDLTQEDGPSWRECKKPRADTIIVD